MSFSWQFAIVVIAGILVSYIIMVKSDPTANIFRKFKKCLWSPYATNHSDVCKIINEYTDVTGEIYCTVVWGGLKWTVRKSQVILLEEKK